MYWKQLYIKTVTLSTHYAHFFAFLAKNLCSCYADGMMNEFSQQITLPAGESMPVRRYLQSRLGISNSMWRRIKNTGNFILNGEPVNATRSVLKDGDRIAFSMEKRPSTIEPEDIPLDIRYEDDWLMVVNKPAKMLVHPIAKEQHGTLGNAVLGYYQRRHLPYAFHPVHRLDRNTTGLVLIAKAPQIQFQLSSKRNQGIKPLHRDYLAIACGEWEPAAGTIDRPIGREDGSFIRQCVRSDEKGRPAVTHYRVIGAADGLSLLELRLETGRTHQIRVHLASIGHPILGDDLYGSPSPAIDRQALHAWRLRFEHPITGEPVEVMAPPPPDMAALLTAFPRVCP